MTTTFSLESEIDKLCAIAANQERIAITRHLIRFARTVVSDDACDELLAIIDDISAGKYDGATRGTDAI